MQDDVKIVRKYGWNSKKYVKTNNIEKKYENYCGVKRVHGEKNRQREIFLLENCEFEGWGEGVNIEYIYWFF